LKQHSYFLPQLIVNDVASKCLCSLMITCHCLAFSYGLSGIFTSTIG